MKFADLHLHTIFSDSTYTPDQLLKEASKQGLSAISIVDHDTVDGIGPTIETARVNNIDIEVIPGLELTAEHLGVEVHILGYLVDYKNEEFIKNLDILRTKRIERIYRIVDKLNGIGVKLKVEDVFDIAGNGNPGRLHIARAMLKNGCISSLAEAFQKYIGDRCAAYICGFKMSPIEAIQLIKNFAGIPVLAHPYSLSRDELLYEFIEEGIMGLEVYYPEHSQSMINFYLDIAKKNNLLVTGGSDCHGNAKAEVQIGSVKIPYELVEKLKERKQKL